MTALLIVSAVVCLLGELLDIAGLVYLGKPVATIAVILLAARSTRPVSPRYRALITAGLICSLVGDVFLMLPSDQFIAGLASFLVAHLLYIVAFAGSGGGLRDLKSASVFVIAGAILIFLWPTLGALKIPVTVYVTVIATMAWQAIARWRQLGSTDARLAAMGAMSFLISDSSLALRKFRGDFPASVLLVLGTYWLAQWWIARSVTHTPAIGDVIAAAAASPEAPNFRERG
jgi:uncharacterized membrane protein YhhN